MNRLTAGLVALLVAASITEAAEIYVENGTTSVFSNVSTNFSGNTYVGDATADNVMIVTNGAILQTDSGAAFIGNDNGASIEQ